MSSFFPSPHWIGLRTFGQIPTRPASPLPWRAGKLRNSARAALTGDNAGNGGLRLSFLRFLCFLLLISVVRIAENHEGLKRVRIPLGQDFLSTSGEREWRNDVTEDDGIVILSALVTNRRGIRAAGGGKAILPYVACPGCERKKVTL